MECIDRLFVIVFMLSEHSFCMHLFDRSGVISSVPFNIHKVSILNIHNERRVIRHYQKPWLFVAAIASCSSVEPEYCHDLAKWLSHYLYFFSFLFFFFSFGLTTTRWSMGKYHMTLSHCHNFFLV